MGWHLDGTYLENCSCDVPCPCTVSFDAGSDYDRCEAMLVFHVADGDVDGTDVSDLSVALVVNSPQVMTEGGSGHDQPPAVLAAGPGRRARRARAGLGLGIRSRRGHRPVRDRCLADGTGAQLPG